MGGRYYGDLGLHLLRQLPYYPYEPLERIFRGAFVRSVLLFVVPQASLILASSLLSPDGKAGPSIRHIALEPIKNSVALPRATNEYFSGS